MRFLRSLVVLSAVLPLIGTAVACDKDHSAKADQAKSAKTASQSTTTNHKTHKPAG